MKQHLAKILVRIGDLAAKNAVCAASPGRCFQAKEPKAAREKYLQKMSEK
ncbi:MAG: hypothetical protein NC347_04410 [Clostridium sp.]|nr:hypothetical protein [Clostridium sp.]